MSTRSHSRRRLQFQQLESRWVMSAGVPLDVPEASTETFAAEFSSLPSRLVDSGDVVTGHFIRWRRTDVDGDGFVGPRDTRMILSALGTSNVPNEQYDVNEDGLVSARDALLVVQQYIDSESQGAFAQPTSQEVDLQRANARKFAIAMAIKQDSVVNDSLVDMLARDFARINAAQPELDLAVDLSYLGQVRVFLTDEAGRALELGEFDAFDQLNEELGVTSVSLSQYWGGGHNDNNMALRFRTPIDEREVSARYMKLDGVKFAQKNGYLSWGSLLGFAPADPYARDGGEYRSYRFEFGSGDCMAGCINRWTVRVFVTDFAVTRVDPTSTVDLRFGEYGSVHW